MYMPNHLISSLLTINSLFPLDKSSSLASNSQELADIFGTSDEVHDMDFPFSLNMGKAFTDLSLPDSRETDFFLNNLNALDSIPVTSRSSMSLERRSERCSTAEEVAVTHKAGSTEGVARDEDSERGGVDVEGSTPKDKEAGDVTSVPGKRRGLKCKWLWSHNF